MIDTKIKKKMIKRKKMYREVNMKKQILDIIGFKRQFFSLVFLCGYLFLHAYKT